MHLWTLRKRPKKGTEKNLPKKRIMKKLLCKKNFYKNMFENIELYRIYAIIHNGMDKNTIDKINDYIVRIKNGDKSAIKPLHATIGVNLRFIAFNYFGSWFAADDITQNFWLNIEKYCKNYRYVYNGLNYLTRIFDNICKKNYANQQEKRSIISLEEINEFEENLIVDPEPNYDRVALKQSFDKAKARMSGAEKSVFAMILYGEMSVREIARASGLTKSTAERIRQSCMRILKQTLDDDGWGNNDV